jgi:CheY-like chemotaxis protein
VGDEQVLIIDDDDDIRQTVTDALEMEHLVVHSARNGQEGLDLIRAGLRPCLILLDMMMPVMDGWKFAQAMAADPEVSALRICIFSATGIRPTQAVPANVVAVLRKPVRLDALLDLMRQNGCRPPTV